MWQFATIKIKEGADMSMLNIVTPLAFLLLVVFLAKETGEANELDFWDIFSILTNAMLFEGLILVLVWVLNPEIAKELIKTSDIRELILIYFTIVAGGTFLYKEWKNIE